MGRIRLDIESLAVAQTRNGRNRIGAERSVIRRLVGVRAARIRAARDGGAGSGVYGCCEVLDELDALGYFVDEFFGEVFVFYGH